MQTYSSDEIQALRDRLREAEEQNNILHAKLRLEAIEQQITHLKSRIEVINQETQAKLVPLQEQLTKLELVRDAPRKVIPANPVDRPPHQYEGKFMQIVSDLEADPYTHDKLLSRGYDLPVYCVSGALNPNHFKIYESRGISWDGIPSFLCENNYIDRFTYILQKGPFAGYTFSYSYAYGLYLKKEPAI
jgi:hypothetical protein